LKDFGRDNEALEFYQKALKFHDEGSIWRDIALLYCRLGQTKQAEAIFTDHINSILGPVEETKDVYTAGVIDFGCEVQYMVRLELNSGRITVVELYNSNDQSLFNILRKVANESGIPFDLVKAEFFKDKVQKELQKISDHHRSQ
jgi:tetratricopeptide (TPR) repeat protein